MQLTPTPKNKPVDERDSVDDLIEHANEHLRNPIGENITAREAEIEYFKGQLSILQMMKDKKIKDM